MEELLDTGENEMFENLNNCFWNHTKNYFYNLLLILQQR